MSAGFTIRQLGEIHLDAGGDELDGDDIYGVILEGSVDTVRAAAKFYGETVTLSALTQHEADRGSAVKALEDAIEFTERSSWQWKGVGPHPQVVVEQLRSALALEGAAAMPVAGDDTHAFKNFHRLLCERFDYTHDEQDWRRDQISLIEHIAKQMPVAGSPVSQSVAFEYYQRGYGLRQRVVNYLNSNASKMVLRNAFLEWEGATGTKFLTTPAALTADAGSPVSEARVQAACAAFGISKNNWFDTKRMRAAIEAALSQSAPSSGKEGQ